jgi:hypothetical protein
MHPKLRAPPAPVLKKSDGCRELRRLTGLRFWVAGSQAPHFALTISGLRSLAACAHEEMWATRRPLCPDTPGGQPNLIMSARGATVEHRFACIQPRAARSVSLRWSHCAGVTALVSLRWCHCAASNSSQVRRPTAWSGVTLAPARSARDAPPGVRTDTTRRRRCVARRYSRVRSAIR